MYKITYIHNSGTKERVLYQPGSRDYCLLSCKLSLGMGRAGSLTMTIPEINAARNDIVCLTDEIVFYRNDVELFRGRAITAQNDFNNNGALECEGILAYLYDTLYPPYDFQGSPSNLISSVLAQHNAKVSERKQIYVGNITVADSNDYIARSCQDYSKSLSVLQDKLVGESLGGYLKVRYANGKRYLDYVDNYGGTATQPIEFGYNLLDIASSVEYGNVITAILPLGAEQESDGETETEETETEETTEEPLNNRITVASVNGGDLYVSDAQAVAQYGWIADCVIWNDVTLPGNLLKKAQAYMENAASAIRKITVKAVDMAQIEPSVTSIFLGDAVHVVSPPHGIDLTAELTEMEIDPFDPSQNTLTFGATERLSDIIGRNQSDAVTLVSKERAARQTALERLSKAMGEGSGLYITPEEQTDGSKVYYLHDQAEVSDSTYVVRVNSQAFGFSTDGGETYPFGFTVDGAMVMDIIEANGISAEWVDFGGQKITKVIDDLGERTTTLETSLKVTEGQISSKVWKSDITEVTDPMGKKITTLEDQYSSINQDVDSISLKVSAVKTETEEAQAAADAAQETANANSSNIKAIEGKLELKIDEDRLVSQLNASADEINITGDRLVIDSTNFKLAADGTVECIKGTFRGRVYSDDVIFSCGKGYLGDGLAGIGLSAGFMEICSDDAPMIRFNRKNGTTGTSYIAEQADGVMTLSPNVKVTDGLSIGNYAVPKIQHGREVVTAGSNFDVKFPIAFPGSATITLTANCNTYKVYYARLITNSATGFTACVNNLTNSDADTVTVHWMAMY